MEKAKKKKSLKWVSSDRFINLYIIFESKYHLTYTVIFLAVVVLGIYGLRTGHAAATRDIIRYIIYRIDVTLY